MKYFFVYNNFGKVLLDKVFDFFGFMVLGGFYFMLGKFELFKKDIS